MSRAGGWLLTTPVPKPQDQRPRLVFERLDASHRAARLAKDTEHSDAVRLSAARRLRRIATLTAEQMHRTNAALAANREHRRESRREAILERIAELEARAEVANELEARHAKREAESLRWHLGTFLK